MIREPGFRISKRPYAVDLDGMSVSTHEDRMVWYSVRIPAVWFRVRRDTPVACVGYLWGALYDQKPAGAVAALGRLDDGRYGGACDAWWDGERYWGTRWAVGRERHLALLRPMLASYPAVPVGFDGWWRYETSQEHNRPSSPTDTTGGLSMTKPNIGTYFVVAVDTPCGCCGETVRKGEQAIYDVGDRLCGYECGCAYRFGEAR